ncbi:hypothetical protein [Brasilonema sp. UFV-L1]|uniref:hypothetical protein n=1 Tax=Brasilonema sp. UFV-L1 TaxID=2234130 RepID=UPI001B7CED28|nr:hypothetical protein [Brasilonema sp. UFV-L1]
MYRKQIALSFAGLFICAAPALISLTPKIGAYVQAERLKAETQLKAENLRATEEFERSRIKQRALTSDELYRSGVAPSATRLRMRRYIDNPNHDPKPDTTGWSTDEVVTVYDSTGKCIGRIENNQWFWKYRVNNACNN